jgi:hypothetical protein
MTGTLLRRKPKVKAICALRIFAMTLSFMCAASEAKASCAAPGPICTSFDQASAVFLADVESVTASATLPLVDVAFRILEVFKGAPGPTLQFTSSVESYRFEPGQRVLVYAMWHGGGLWSATCTRTWLFEERHSEIEVLRSLARGSTGGMLDGGLVTVDGERAVTNRHPGVRVTLRSTSNRGRVSSTTTNEAGYFQFGWLNPGDYIVVLERRPGYERQQQRVRVAIGQRCLSLRPFVVPFPP